MKRKTSSRTLPKSAIEFLDDLQSRGSELSLMLDELADMAFGGNCTLDEFKAKRSAMKELQLTVTMDVDGMRHYLDRAKRLVEQVDAWAGTLSALYFSAHGDNGACDGEIGRWGTRDVFEYIREQGDK